MAKYEITAELHLKNLITESREVAQALTEFADNLEKIEKKYAEPQGSEDDKGKLWWLGKNCKDCGNEKCKKLGTLPKGYSCALWQPESEEIK